MKKKIAIMLCSFISFVCADYPPSYEKMVSESGELKEGLVYFRFIAADPSIFTQYQIHPGCGIGYRRIKGSSAFDAVASLGGHGSHYRDAHTWVLPRVSYLHYLNPLADQTMYLGAGMGFGGVESRRKNGTQDERHEFVGLLGNLTAGVELCRREACVVMSELTISQPLVPANRPKGISGPSAELSCGLGF